MEKQRVLLISILITVLINCMLLSSEVIAQNQHNKTKVKTQQNKAGIKTQQLPLSDEISKKYGFTISQELILGKSVAYALLEKFNNKLYTDEKANRYINLVGKAVAKSSSKRPQIQYKFGIIDDDEVNAFACPGGYIFITKGLLFLLKNENELAAVLAHEIGHVEYGDNLKDINYYNRNEYARVQVNNIEANTAAINDIATSLPNANWYASYYSPKNMAKNNLKTMTGNSGKFVLSDESKVGEISKKLAQTMLVNMFYKPLTPICEYKADEFSVKALAKMGYNPKGMEGLLRTLGELGVNASPNSSSGAKNVFSYTHPSVAERINKIETAATAPTQRIVK